MSVWWQGARPRTLPAAVAPVLVGTGAAAAEDGAPEVRLDSRSCGLSISLSHRAGTAVCAVVRAPAVIGCDLERIERIESL